MREHEISALKPRSVTGHPAYSKRAASAHEVKQPQAGQHNQGGLKKADFSSKCLLCSLFLCQGSPSVSLILIFKSVPMIPYDTMCFYLLSYMIALLCID